MGQIDLLQGEKILANVKGDCYRTPDTYYSQTSGNYIITNKRIIFQSYGIKALQLKFEINISEIEKLETCNVGFFMPTGINVCMKQGGRYMLSLLKRKKYITMIQEQM